MRGWGTAFLSAWWRGKLCRVISGRRLEETKPDTPVALSGPTCCCSRGHPGYLHQPALPICSDASTKPWTKVTHEAAVGTVDQKQLETLMAHGLTPEQAVDAIIVAMLR